MVGEKLGFSAEVQTELSAAAAARIGPSSSRSSVVINWATGDVHRSLAPSSQVRLRPLRNVRWAPRHSTLCVEQCGGVHQSRRPWNQQRATSSIRLASHTMQAY